MFEIFSFLYVRNTESLIAILQDVPIIDYMIYA